MEQETYKLIYADPPWFYKDDSYQSRTKTKRSTNHAGLHYPCMPHDQMLAEIAPVMSDLADPTGCLMLMWITNKHCLLYTSPSPRDS